MLSQGISTDKQSGLTCRSLSECGCSGIHHPAEPVRKVAERVLVLVYKINPRLVRKQLPPDDDVTRRNLLYRQLFTEFDKLDLQRQKEMLEANRANPGPCFDTLSPPPNCSAVSTLKCVSAQSPPAEHKTRTMQYDSRSRFGYHGNRGSDNSSGSGSPKRILKSKSGYSITITNSDETTKGISQVPKKYNGKLEYNEISKQQINSGDNNSNKSSNSDSIEEQDNTGSNCPFCDWSYVGDATQLDKHFWKACPILTKCPQCSQVLEVAALNMHLTSKCDIWF